MKNQVEGENARRIDMISRYEIRAFNSGIAVL